jgi:hypothetical protein
MSGSSKKLFNMLWITTVLLVVVLGLAIFGLIQKHTSTVQAELQLEEEKAKLSSIQAITTMLNDTKDDRQYLSELFVDKQSVVDFLEFVESIGGISHSKLTVESVDFAEADSNADLATVRFNARGTWPQIAKVISLSDHLPMAAVITSVQIVKEQNDEVPVVAPQSTSTSSKSSANSKKAPEPEYWHAAFEVKVLKSPTK